MTLKLSLFARLLKRVKYTWTAKHPDYAEVPPGACAVVFPDKETYQLMISALADAQQWTGIDYPEILNRSKFLIN